MEQVRVYADQKLLSGPWPLKTRTVFPGHTYLLGGKEGKRILEEGEIVLDRKMLEDLT